MSTTRWTDWDNVGGITAGAPAARTGGSRRSLFGVAARSLALAAGGMVAPPVLQTVMAGNINPQSIVFSIKNHRSAAVQFQPWEWNDDKKRWVSGDLVTLSPPGPDDTHAVRATDGRLALHFSDGFFVLGRDANQQTVLIEIGEGLCDASGCARDHILHLLTAQRLHEGESMSAADFAVTRLRNTKRVLCQVELV